MAPTPRIAPFALSFFVAATVSGCVTDTNGPLSLGDVFGEEALPSQQSPADPDPSGGAGGQGGASSAPGDATAESTTEPEAPPSEVEQAAEDDAIGALANKVGGKAGPVATLDGKRFTVFYQVSKDVLATYADPVKGLPKSPKHVHVFTHSCKSNTCPGIGKAVHEARSDFRYAPAYDLNQHDWHDASDAQLAVWAHEFRDKAIAAGADFFAFNEVFSTAGKTPKARIQMARILRHLNDPDANGVSLRGIIFFTHGPSMAKNWSSPANAFWKAVDDTCDAVVFEHYHGVDFLCDNGTDYLEKHYFGLRDWLLAGNTPAKTSIATKKFTLLHSTAYVPGGSLWGGADSNETSLAKFHRTLSRAAWLTRKTAGGMNRISFAPIYSEVVTNKGVHGRVAALARWHYDGSSETECIDGSMKNCECKP